MKTYFLILSIFTSSVCFGQFRNADKPKSVNHDTLTLSQWQQEQFAVLENQKKMLDEKINFLVRTILDFNKIKENSVVKLEYQNNKLIVIRKQDE